MKKAMQKKYLTSRFVNKIISSGVYTLYTNILPSGTLGICRLDQLSQFLKWLITFEHPLERRQ